MRCNYVLVRYVPDLVRQEPLNIGVIVQSPLGLYYRFIPSLGARKHEIDLVPVSARDIQDQFSEWFAKETHEIFIPDSGETRSVPTNSVELLQHLRRVLQDEVRLSEVRIAELEINSEVQIQDYLASLFDLFISPKGRLPRRTLGTRVRTYLRRDLRLLDLLWLPGLPPEVQERRVREGELLQGVVNLWPVDFTYRNTRKVAISTLDLNVAYPLDKAKALTGVYLDVERAGKEDAYLVSVFQSPRETREQAEAERQLRSLPGTSFDYVAQKAELLRLVVEDLGDYAATERFNRLFRSGL